VKNNSQDQWLQNQEVGMYDLRDREAGGIEPAEGEKTPTFSNQQIESGSKWEGLKSADLVDVDTD
jgi:hypothetical protein